MIKVGIVGGSGYTGVELLRILSAHPEVRLTTITARGDNGTKVADMFPSLRGIVDLTFVAPEESNLKECDVVFFATPHGVAMSHAKELLDAGVKSSISLPISGLKTRPNSKNGTVCPMLARTFWQKRFTVLSKSIVKRSEKRVSSGWLVATPHPYSLASHRC